MSRVQLNVTIWPLVLMAVANVHLSSGCGRNGEFAAPSSTGPAAPVETKHLLPTAVRRLTNREFRKLASSVLESAIPRDLEERLPPDVRQEDGYARNVDQTMSGALALALEREVPALVRQALKETPALFPCEGQEPECVREWIRRKRRVAFRRPATEEEVEASLRLFHRAPEPSLAAEVVLSELLSSPRLWYVTELGSGSADADRVALTHHEIADQIALVIRGSVADEQLVAAADARQLMQPEVRRLHARRLLGMSDTREHYREFVTAWLEVDRLNDTSKSQEVFERYETFKPLMLAETERFTDEVFVAEGASVRALLDGRFAAVDPAMAVFYGMSDYGPRADSTRVGRLGVLQHASFLASHSHPDTTSPVLRGDFVLRKVLCNRLPRPSELDIEVFMPRPTSTMTRREQFARHSADPRCSDCHDQIDGFGLVFEEFDAAGRRRTSEGGAPVRTDGRVTYAGRWFSFADSRELAQWLSVREETTQCFGRQLFRFVTGRVASDAEDAFVELRQSMALEARNNVLEHLVAYVSSETFILRRGSEP